SILPHLYLAAIYRETGRDDLALFHVESASALSPQDPFLHLQKGLILLARGKRSEAADEIRFGSRLLNISAAPSASPEEVQRFMVLNLYRQRRYREAVFHAMRLLRAHYDDPQLHALVAECCRSMGDLAKAENHYRRALEKDRSSPEIRYGLLAVLWERGDYATLLAESERVLQKSRNDETGSYFHSLALSRSGADVTAVLPELQRQVRSRGPDPVLMSELGAAYARAGLPELAEGWYERALKLAPPSPRTLEILADVYGALGRTKKLIGVFRRYLEISPDDRPARRKYVRLLLGQDGFAEASEQIALLLPLEPSNEKLKSTLAVCYRRMGRYADALVIIRDLLSQTPGSVELMKAAVYCLDKMGSRAVAVRVIESFLREHGDSLSLVLMLGVLQFQENALEKASATFRRAVSMAPKDWRANRNLGMVYRRMGNETFAEKFLEKAASCRAQAEARTTK
ncbi:MAG TPA: tetratricopeptide repeat protein, partial [Spirochaetia bacterium]